MNGRTREMQIGAAALQAIGNLMGSEQSSAKLQVAKPIIRPPESEEECRALKAWADSIDDRPQPATPSQIARHLEFMSATLPSRNIDEETGRMRFAVYSRLLGEYSNDALAYMARNACTKFDWFPTPRQCLEILAEYRPAASEKERALMLCHSFWQGRFEDFITALKSGDATQEMVDAVNKQWRFIAMERGFLRHMPDGSFIIRPPRSSIPPPQSMADVQPKAERPKRTYCSVCLFATDNPLVAECQASNCGMSTVKRTAA